MVASPKYRLKVGKGRGLFPNKLLSFKQSIKQQGKKFIALGSALAFLAPDSSFSPSANGQSMKCIAANFIQANPILQKSSSIIKKNVASPN